MDDLSVGVVRPDDDQLFQEAVAAATEWGAAGRVITGLWLDRRGLRIGVGLADGDEMETTEELRGLISDRISIRTRVCSSRLAELWHLQIELSDYLHDSLIWERWAVKLGVNAQRDILEIGLRPETPRDVPDQIRARFLDSPIDFVTAVPARAA